MSIQRPTEGDRSVGHSVEALEPSMTPNPDPEGLAERLGPKWHSLDPDARLETREQAAALLRSQAVEIEGLKAEKNEARASLAYLLDHATYGDSYGVPGSDFTACHLCQGGGAPGVAMEHEESCPVSRYPAVVAEWFDEMAAERDAAEAAEAALSRLQAEMKRKEEALRGLAVAIEKMGLDSRYTLSVGQWQHLQNPLGAAMLALSDPTHDKDMPPDA